MWCVHTYIYGTEYYQAIKKEWNTICSNKHGPTDHDTEQNKSERETSIIPLIFWYSEYLVSAVKISI